MDKIVYPGIAEGTVKAPASKSHTIRAILFASLAEGESILIDPLLSADALSCMYACRKFGATIKEKGSRWHIVGTGGHVHAPDDVIDVGNSGTTLYFITAAACLSPNWTVITGDEQIRSRPVQPLINSLTDLGAQGFTTQNNGSPPLVIRGPLKGGNTEIKCHTSQYLSALLITLPLMRQDSVVYTPVLNERPYVEMTLKWLEDMRVYAEVKEGNLFFIGGRHKYKGFGEKQIPADYSSATFLFCAAAITGGSVTVQGLDPEDPQGDKRVLNILAKMGCSVMWDNWDVTVKGGILKGTEIDMNDIPDALPALAVTAAFAEDNTTLYNVEHARLKETDRITAMCQEMRKLGITVDEQTDGLIIFGGKKPTEGTVNSRGDHRIAMAFAIAALGARGPVEIQNAGAVSITYPSFFTVLDQLTGGTAK